MYSETFQTQYDWLRSLLENNYATMLPGVNGVEEVSPPVGVNLPLLGVMWTHTSERPGDAQGYVTQVNHFEVTIAFTSDFDPANGDEVRELKARVEKALNGRDGTGLLPLLRSDPTMGGLAQYAGPGDILPSYGRDVQDQTRQGGQVTVTFDAYAEMRLQ